jgi:hypothetical protein
MIALRACAVPGVAALVLAAACGGDDGLSREEFVSEADAICQEFDQRVDDVEQPQSPDDVERYVDEVRPVIEDGLNELEGLQPPEEFEDQWNQLVARNDESLEALDDLRRAAANGDVERLQEISEEASRRDDESDRIAREIGLQECAGEN